MNHIKVFDWNKSKFTSTIPSQINSRSWQLNRMFSYIDVWTSCIPFESIVLIVIVIIYLFIISHSTFMRAIPTDDKWQ